MKALAVVLPLALAAGVFGQTAHRGFGSAVFPGGTSGTSPGITRSFGSAVFPGGTLSAPVYRGTTLLPSGQNFRRTPAYGRGTTIMPSYVYAFPMFVGGYDNSYAPQEAAPQQPNVIVIYPPQQPATPVMIQAGPDGEYTTTGGQRQTGTIYEAPRDTTPEAEPAPDSTHFLLAFKDHTIYSAVAYWADGDTLHYFTSGNVHNQASISLLDRDLTERLNRELGIEFKLPAAK
ncbi:MAG: hypothetical protein ABSC05_01790 [Candidatus Solibacter sp.]|jgi:hypothetical protein